jgi:acetyltransferase
VRTALDLPAYPAHLARERRLADGRRVLIRPVRPDDAAAESTFFSGLSARTLRLRFQRFAGVVDEALMRFYTRIDYDRHMAFVCEHDGRIVGDARYVANPNSRSCELGIVVADDWHHTGVAQLLLDALVRFARARCFETLEGLVLAENADMLDFVREQGFDIRPAAEDPSLVRVVRKL